MNKPKQLLPLSYEQMRSLVLEALTTCQSGSTSEIDQKVAELVVKHGHVQHDHSQFRYSLPRDETDRVADIYWDLLVEGIVRPGRSDGMNSGLAWFHVTDHGKSILRGLASSPYDPDGYLTGLSSSIASIDPVILTYLNESLRTFRIGCYLSSTISLGCASEKAILQLIDTLASVQPATSNFKSKTDGKHIKTQFEEMNKLLTGKYQPTMPQELRDSLDIYLNGIFTLLRIQRNDAGHPSGKTVDREEAHANLSLFQGYLKRVYNVMDWVRTNPAP